MAVIELKGIQRHYVLGDITVKALRGVDLSVEQAFKIILSGGMVGAETRKKRARPSLAEERARELGGPGG